MSHAERRELLDLDDGPPGLDGKVRYLYGRQAALALAFTDALARYAELHGRFTEDGTDDAVRSEALQTANDLGLLLQDMRRHQDRFNAQAKVDPDRRVPFEEVDILFACLVALSAPPEMRAATELLYTPAQLRELFADSDLTRWLAWLGTDLDGSELDD